MHTCNQGDPPAHAVGITNHPAPNHLQDGRSCALDWLAASIVSCWRTQHKRYENGLPFDVLRCVEVSLDGVRVLSAFGREVVESEREVVKPKQGIFSGQSGCGQQQKPLQPRTCTRQPSGAARRMEASLHVWVGMSWSVRPQSARFRTGS